MGGGLERLEDEIDFFYYKIHKKMIHNDTL